MKENENSPVSGVYTNDQLLSKMVIQVFDKFTAQIKIDETKAYSSVVRRYVCQLFERPDVQVAFCSAVHDTIKGLNEYFDLAKEQNTLIELSRRKLVKMDADYKKMYLEYKTFQERRDKIKKSIKDIDELKLRYPNERFRQAKMMYDEMIGKMPGENSYEYQRRISAIGKIIAAALGAADVSDSKDYSNDNAATNLLNSELDPFKDSEDAEEIVFQA